jgi:uncharacterized protein YfiM (DUF2279 family)
METLIKKCYNTPTHVLKKLFLDACHGMAIDSIYLAEKIFQTFQAARYLEGAGMPVHSPSLQGHNQTCFKFTFVIKIFCLGDAFEMKFTKLTCFGLNTLRPSHRDSIMGQNAPQDSVN